MSGNGGGSDEMKHLNIGCASAYTDSSSLSKVLSQDSIKCTFYNITQLPYSAPYYKASLALFSYP